MLRCVLSQIIRGVLCLIFIITLEMRADMWTNSTMRLYGQHVPMSNHSTSNLMSNFSSDRQHERYYLSPLMVLDLPYFHSFWFLC